MRVLIFIFVLTIIDVKGERLFRIDHRLKTFSMDGEPFQIMSGTLHYFQVIPEYWEDRMKKMKALGLNALQTYIQWNLHEPDGPSQYNFKGRFDIFKFIQMAHDNGLYVILRPGPYIDAEREMGGLPWWLLKVNPDMKIRTMDFDFIKYVDNWFDYLLPRLKQYLYPYGGPIIMAQVENEYGFFGCDDTYKIHIRDKIKQHFGESLLLYTTDNAQNSIVYSCGKVPNVYSTVDFIDYSELSMKKCFYIQRHFEPNSPLMDSEFYPGWIDHWGYSHQTKPTQNYTRALEFMLKRNASVNIYPVYGGTMWGFENGANANDINYKASITSYDFDAPIAESGDLTKKYFGIKKVISKIFPKPSRY